MKRVGLFFIGSLCVVGCAERVTVLTVPAISMTNPSLAGSENARPAGRVQAEYCAGDDSLLSEGDGNVGLIDEAVIRAERESRARYLSDVTVTEKGSCVSVDAMAMR